MGNNFGEIILYYFKNKKIVYIEHYDDYGLEKKHFFTGTYVINNNFIVSDKILNKGKEFHKLSIYQSDKNQNNNLNNKFIKTYTF